MSGERGLLSLDQLSQQVETGQIDTVLTVFTDLYGRFVGKRLDATHFLETAAKDGTHACDYLLTVDMEMEPVAGYEFANWQKGYGDFHLSPDLDTMRHAAWLDRTAMVICDVASTSDHSLIDIAPRSILKKQIERAADMGFTAKAASEVEYFIYRNSYRDAAENGYHYLEAAGWYIEDYHALQGTRMEGLNGAARRNLAASGIPVESTKGEWGLGQHELNLKCADVLTMADHHAVYKQCMKETADEMGMSVTFMAKPDSEQAGSSCHVHLSLWQDGVGVFTGGENADAGLDNGSDLFRWFLGGWMAHVHDMMAFYAPTVNSYKRYQSGSWAPTRIAWSHDNRTAGFRVVGTGESLRIECRIPGADCNPYLVYAAALASGLDGIANKAEPPDVFSGDAYEADHLPHVPNTLSQATDLFESSDFVVQSFGKDVAKHYWHFFRAEQDSFDKAVTDWERQRYFERI